MTALPEAKLARGREMCYAIVATITDYDVWKEDDTVTIGQVIENATKNERHQPGRDTAGDQAKAWYSHR